MGTPLFCVFYWLMGAKIHPSARIETFIREFDRIDEGAWLKKFQLGHNCGLEELMTWDQVA